MKTEANLVNYILDAKYDEIPKPPINIIKSMILINLGSLVAGSNLQECIKLIDMVKNWGGRPEASILVHNGKVPGYNAAFANSTMCRVLDFGDAMPPGIHIGPVSIPASLAAVELAGGCSGKEFLTSLTVGVELASRINKLNVKGHLGSYKGFKPTGVCSGFGGAAVAGRILGLNSDQMSNALSLVFNRAGGSLQGNIEGAQTVALVAGFTAQSSLICTELAQRGFIGPRDFLEGVYGYCHLYTDDYCDRQALLGELGQRFELNNTIFKQYPHCGLIQTSTQGILELVRNEGLTPEEVVSITVWIQPSTHKDIGRFEIGNSPRQNAQFSLPYCVASALLRGSSQFEHFEESYIREPQIVDIVKRIKVVSSPAMEERDQTSMDMEVKTRQGVTYFKSIDTPRGFPSNPMNREEYAALFKQCVDYGGRLWPQEKIENIITTIEGLEELSDVRALVALFC